MRSSAFVFGFVVFALSTIVSLSLIAAQGVRIDRAGGYSCDIVADTSGRNVAVIYCPPSGTGQIDVKVAYSTTSGATWALLGPLNLRQLDGSAVGVDAPPGLIGSPVYFCWNEYVRMSEVSPLMLVFDEGGFPNGSLQRRLLPRSDTNGSCPYVALDPNNSGHLFYGGKVSADLYHWISADGGYTWSNRTLWVQSQGRQIGRPHLSFGRSGYLFATFNRDTIYNSIYTSWPFYTESSNGGTSWTVPKPMWDIPPYDSARAGRFSSVVTGDGVPLVVGETKLGFVSSGDIWFFYADSGGIGNRHWQRRLLRGNGQGATVADNPDISYNSRRDLVAAAWCENSKEGRDIFITWSFDRGRNWAQPVKATNNGDTIAENALSMSRYLGCGVINAASASMLYVGGGYVYYLRFDNIPLVIEEVLGNEQRAMSLRILQNPTTTRQGVRLMVAGRSRKEEARLRIYDVSGKVVWSYRITNHDLPITVCWDACDQQGAALPAGVYFIRLEGAGATRTAKAVVME